MCPFPLEGDDQGGHFNRWRTRAANKIDLHAVNGPGGGAVANVLPGDGRPSASRHSIRGFTSTIALPAATAAPIAQGGMYGAILVESVGGLPLATTSSTSCRAIGIRWAGFGDKGHQPSARKGAGEQPEYFTFNRPRQRPYDYRSGCTPVGETVRVFFSVWGPNASSNHYRQIFDKVYTGSPETFIRNEESWRHCRQLRFYFRAEAGHCTGRIISAGRSRSIALQKGAAGILHVTGRSGIRISIPHRGRAMRQRPGQHQRATRRKRADRFGSALSFAAWDRFSLFLQPGRPFFRLSHLIAGRTASSAPLTSSLAKK